MNNIDTLRCPVCGMQVWSTTGKFTHRISDSRWESGYAALQRKVYFDIWHEETSEVNSQRLLCRKCGMVVDSPRPDENDIINKYSFLAKEEKHLGAMDKSNVRIQKDEIKYIHELMGQFYKYHSSDDVLDIMDYGGGDGHLLLPMISKGHNGYLVDYNHFPVEGIEHIADDMDTLSEKYSFDFVICRHVLEHMAVPGDLLKRMKSYLKENGLVFVEVPIEIYGESRPRKDPVTHVNYFQHKSLRILFENAGYSPLYYINKKVRYHGRIKRVAQVLAKINSEECDVDFDDSVRYSQKLMDMSKNQMRFFLLKEDPLRFFNVIIHRIQRIKANK